MTNNIPIVLSLSEFTMSAMVSVLNDNLIYVISTVCIRVLEWYFFKRKINK